MTNSPPFDQQLAIDAYWQDVGGMEFLPGTGRAADRFVRASWYLDAVEKVPEPRVATATVFSLVRGVSVPIGLADPKKPNLSSTMWRTVADLGAKRYFYESVFSPSVFWVDIDTLGLGEGTGVRKLELGGSPILAGEVSAEFKPSEPFGFLTN
ncbi:MAG: linear amide C-N hydrolase [Rhodobacteraceae bacterium]|nr:linear amide C-N hydrolase [Paracoccaceae bacterium]